ncbi:MAG TPA: methyltransferase [Sedimentisphaerales bacterium]|nr:methyltransferase [Sedimentisphaerales bacterium]
MEVKNAAIESFLKSFAFSLLLCLYCAFFAFIRARSLLKDFDLFELLHLICNLTLALLFLIRTRPSVVSMNLIHWTVALITSLSGFLFVRESVSPNRSLLFAGHALMIFAFLIDIVAALTLARSFGFLPALRRVKTKYLYQLVRHPMYLASMVLRLGYVLMNPSVYNALLTVLIILLYGKRAKYEEQILSHDNSYVDYLNQVKSRFIPAIY